MSIYVNAVWSQFVSSKKEPDINVFNTLDSASKDCDPENDIVLKFDDPNSANRYVKAFKTLCEVVNEEDGACVESRVQQGHLAIDTWLTLESLEKESEIIIPKR